MAVGAETKFIVLMTGRSGSVWVMSTLNNIPGVTAHGALFLPRSRAEGTRWDSDFAHTRFIETKSKGFNYRPFSVFSYLNDLYSTPGSVGFKLNYAQFGYYPELLAYLIWHRINVIHLVRKNQLDILISYKVKAKLGKAHLLSGQSSPDDLQITLDTDNLVQRLSWLQKKQRLGNLFLNLCGLRNMEIAYEDLLRDENNFNKIFDFLGLNSEEHTPEFSTNKIRKGSHREVVQNYEEVKEVLASTQFASLLD
ncbi:MAG: hypothetical protein JSW42_14875 [Chloroflexota bacterium]|nr:MAG: hypothetical protein JSW42_14875 [Chloroflexota bacterium]